MSDVELLTLVNAATRAQLTGNSPLALAALERAAQIDPNSQLIRERMTQARQAVGQLIGESRLDAAEGAWVPVLRDLPTSPFLLFAGFWFAAFSYRTFKKLLQGRSPVFSFRQLKSRVWLLLGVLGLGFFALIQWSRSIDRGILLEQTLVRSGPGESFDEMARIPAGVRVVILDERAESSGAIWVKTQFDQSKRGWVPLSKIGATLPSRPFDLSKN